MKTHIIFFTAICLAIGGCTPQGREAYHQADQSGSQAAQQFAAAGKTDAKATLHDLKADSEKSNGSLGKMWQNTKQDAANLAITVKVKSALSSSKSVDTSDLKVVTTGTTIHLKGVVPNASERTQAGQIAKKEANGKYTIDNDLTLAVH